MDQWGNLTKMKQYGYDGSLLRTYENTYLSTAPYTDRFIRNRVLTTKVTEGGGGGGGGGTQTNSGGAYSVTAPVTFAPNTEQTFAFTIHLPSGGTTFNSVFVQFQNPALAPADGSGVPSSVCEFQIDPPSANHGEVQFYTDSGARSSSNLFPPDDWTTAAVRTNSQCMLGLEHLMSIAMVGNDLVASIPITFIAQRTYHMYMSANYQTNPGTYHALLTNGHEWVDLGQYVISSSGGGGGGGGGTGVTTLLVNNVYDSYTGFNGTTGATGGGVIFDGASEQDDGSRAGCGFGFHGELQRTGGRDIVDVGNFG